MQFITTESPFFFSFIPKSKPRPRTSSIDSCLRFSHMITSGNELDLVLADYVNYMVDDPNTDTIVLFIEANRNLGNLDYLS